MRRPAAAALLLLLAAPAGAQPEPRVSVTPPASWVDLVEPPLQASSRGVDTSEGIHHLLLDQQVNLAVEPVAIYSRNAWRVLGETGVQNGSELRIAFDPSYERLVLHQVTVHRDGERLDRLDAARVRLLQREERLDAQIYDGTMTALLFVEGVRDGDVVDYSYTLEGVNPSFGKRFATAFDARWSVPLAQHRHRVLVPEGRELRWKSHGLDLRPRQLRQGRLLVLEWRQEQVPALLLEADAVFESWPWVQVTEWERWEDLSRWGRELFEPAEPLPAELVALAASWKRETREPAELARRALRLVQDEVRYLGIEFGVNAYRPSEPANVYARRFGDCKDKSVLLVQLLRELGLEADAALVSTLRGHWLEQQLPTPLAFDHAAVRLRIGERSFWLDATRMHERGPLERLGVPDWEQALLLDERASGLVPVESRDFGRTRIEEQLDCADPERPAFFRVKTIHEGSAADAARAQLAASSRDELARSYRNFYSSLWAGIETVRPLEVEDDEAENRLSISERYEIRGFWTEPDAAGRRQAEIWNLVLDQELLVPDAIERRAPLGVGHPVLIMQTTRLTLPRDTIVEERDLAVRDRHFRFDLRTRAEAPGGAEIEHRYETLRAAVSPEQVGEYRARVEQARSGLGLVLVTSPQGLGASLRSVEWPVALLLLFAFAATAATAALLTRSPADEPGVGLPIGGWLAPVTLAVMLSPVAGLARMLLHRDALGRRSWRELTDPGSAGWIPFGEAERLLGLAGGALLCALALVLLARWLGRRRSAPLLAMLAAGLTWVLWLADGLLELAAAPEPAAPALALLGRLLALGLVLGLLAAYLLRSERVRLTFAR